MGNTISSSIPDFKNWCKRLGINTIWDVAEWDIETPHMWIVWMILECPVELEMRKLIS